MIRSCYPILLLLILSCRREPGPLYQATADSSYSTFRIPVDTPPVITAAAATSSTSPAQVVAFAKTLLGTPYKFGCTAPATGFDCSGFITYVFNHFDIDVPRSSVDFTNEGTSVPLADAKPGDLILFTGTNSKIRTVGHIGLIVANDTSGIHFIHSSSGKQNAVIITELDERYMIRFVKVIRMLK